MKNLVDFMIKSSAYLSIIFLLISIVYFFLPLPISETSAAITSSMFLLLSAYTSYTTTNYSLERFRVSQYIINETNERKYGVDKYYERDIYFLFWKWSTGYWSIIDLNEVLLYDTKFGALREIVLNLQSMRRKVGVEGYDNLISGRKIKVFETYNTINKL